MKIWDNGGIGWCDDERRDRASVNLGSGSSCSSQMILYDVVSELLQELVFMVGVLNEAKCCSHLVCLGRGPSL